MIPHLLILLSFACLFVGCSGEELVIFGAMSLTDALTEVSQRFGETRNVKVYCNFRRFFNLTTPN